MKTRHSYENKLKCYIFVQKKSKNISNIGWNTLNAVRLTKNKKKIFEYEKVMLE